MQDVGIIFFDIYFLRDVSLGSRRQGGRGGSGSLNSADMAKYRGEQGPGCKTARDWRRPGLSTFCEKPPDKNTKDWTVPRFGRELGEGEAGAWRRGGTHNR